MKTIGKSDAQSFVQNFSTSLKAGTKVLFILYSLSRKKSLSLCTLILPGGALLIRKGIELQPALQNGVKLYTYSQEEGSDYRRI